MSGVCGWFGRSQGDASSAMRAMLAGSGWPHPAITRELVGDATGLGVCGPDGTLSVLEVGPLKVAIQGHPFWLDDAGQPTPTNVFARRLADRYQAHGVESLQFVGGDFALALVDERNNRVLLAIDRMGIRNFVYTFRGGLLTFGPSCDAVNAHPAAAKRVNNQALYNYVHFHMVPGPETIFTDQARLLPGHYLLLHGESISTRPYWQMRFTEDRKTGFADLKREFRSALTSGVNAFALNDHCGTFLSGGTDSSTLSGMLGQRTGRPAKTFSIGFDAAGYDEMEYARITARHFQTDHREYYVTPADTLEAVPILANAYDQPFGNASAVPTYYCARLARNNGVTRMLAGDGGDELFGGNSRYAKQYQLALYERIPESVRRLVVEPLVRAMPKSDAVTLLRRARSYVEQASLPMPARYETYNLLQRIGAETIFDPSFLATINPAQPSALLKRVHDASNATSLINQMLAIDLQFTLADNDLPKVTRMCDAAGVDIAFPLLHDSVVAFSSALPPRLKLRGTRLRYFFKEALRDFLAPETIAKEKHGFGLPAGLWLRDYPPLRDLAGDALASLRKRSMFRREFLDGLMATRIQEHAGYYGTMVWILMMLELWFERHADRG